MTWTGWHRDIDDFMKLERRIAKEMGLSIDDTEVINRVDEVWAATAPGR